MAATHAPATRNGIAALVLANIDADVGAGNLVFQTTGGAADVATLPLTDPAGVVAAEVLTFNAISSDTNAAGGTIAEASIQANLGAEVLHCDVGVSGSDINLSSLVISAGDTVTVSALTYTAPV